jgi:hypothetical protein
MTPDDIATQLRSLAVENRNKADFFEIAAQLHESGYQIDQAKIDTEIQAYKDSIATEMDTLVAEKAALIAENDALKAENADLKKTASAEPV